MCRASFDFQDEKSKVKITGIAHSFYLVHCVASSLVLGETWSNMLVFGG